jgi:hypothetical protein
MVVCGVLSLFAVIAGANGSHSDGGTYAAGDAGIGVFLGGAESYYTKDALDPDPADGPT